MHAKIFASQTAWRDLRLPDLQDGPGAGKEGLSSAQARSRLRRFGPNTFRDQ